MNNVIACRWSFVWIYQPLPTNVHCKSSSVACETLRTMYWYDQSLVVLGRSLWFDGNRGENPSSRNPEQESYDNQFFRRLFDDTREVLGQSIHSRLHAWNRHRRVFRLSTTNYSSPQLNLVNLAILGPSMPTQSLGSTLIHVGAKLENPKGMRIMEDGELVAPLGFVCSNSLHFPCQSPWPTTWCCSKCPMPPPLSRWQSPTFRIW